MTRKKILIAPSILSADFGFLSREARDAERAGADWLHVDVMDGRFVPNLTIGFVAVKALHRAVKIPLDVHLMIEQPEKYIERFAEAGASSITVHAEATGRLKALVRQIRRAGTRVGVCIRPKSPLGRIRKVLGAVDMVLLMSVEPGFGGQSFMPSVLPKIRALRREWPKGLIEVDGGINPQTAPRVIKAGANVLVAGSAIFGKPNRRKAIQALRNDL